MEYESIRTQYTNLEREFADRNNANYETWRLTHHTLITLGLVRDSSPHSPAFSGDLGTILKLSDYPTAHLPSQAEPNSADNSTSPAQDGLNDEAVNILPHGQKLVAFGCLANGRNFLIHQGAANVGQPNIAVDNFGVEMWSEDSHTTYPAKVERFPEELLIFVAGVGTFIIPHNSGASLFVLEADGKPMPIPLLHHKFSGDPQS